MTTKPTTESNEDRELELDILQYVTTEHERGEFDRPCSTHIRFDEARAYREVKKLIQRSQLALLSRIDKEVIGPDVDLPKSIMPKHGQAMQNILKRKQRAAIDTIKAEIEGSAK